MQADAVLQGGSSGGSNGDSSWDALFDSAGRLIEDGWTAEMAIPFKSLRYPTRARGEMHRWGLQIRREIRSKDESVVWAPISRDLLGFLRQMGVLEGLTNLSTSRNLEFLPTATAIQVGNLDQTTGAYTRRDVEEGGLNVKYGVTSNLTVDFTYNPDFSQIESDTPQIEVNQRFPLRFPELRPFFLEGQEIYNIPGPVRVVHTRTIVDPRYGLKLTGKVGRTSVGLLVADDEGPGHVDDPDDPAFGRGAQVVIARLRYDLYSESHIGALLTDREFLDGFSRLGALDGRWQLGRNYRLALKAMTIRHRDEDGVERTGEFLEAVWRKEGRNLRYGLFYAVVDPDFRTDVGFVRRTDMRQVRGNVSYRWWPESWVVNWGPRFDYERNFDHDGVLQDEIYGTGFNVQFARNIQIEANYNRDMERFGDIDFWKTRYSFGADVSTSRRISFGADINTGDQVRFVDSPFLGSSTGSALNMTLRPFARLQSRVSVDTSRLVDPRTSTEVFDVKIFRGITTYQFTDRFLVRNISEYNTFDKTLAANLLLTYRVNAGTVFFVGYDDHYRQGGQTDELAFPTEEWWRTNRAIFTKFQYLFRY